MVWGHPSRLWVGGVRSPSPGLCAFQICVSGSVYTCPWRRHPHQGLAGLAAHLCSLCGRPNSFHSWLLPFSGLVTWAKAPHFWEKGSAAGGGLGGARGALLWGGGPGQAAGAPCDPESTAPSWNLGFAAMSWAWVGWVGGWMMRWRGAEKSWC